MVGRILSRTCAAHGQHMVSTRSAHGQHRASTRFSFQENSLFFRIKFYSWATAPTRVCAKNTSAKKVQKAGAAVVAREGSAQGSAHSPNIGYKINVFCGGNVGRRAGGVPYSAPHNSSNTAPHCSIALLTHSVKPHSHMHSHCMDTHNGDDSDSRTSSGRPIIFLSNAASSKSCLDWKRFAGLAGGSGFLDRGLFVRWSFMAMFAAGPVSDVVIYAVIRYSVRAVKKTLNDK